MARPEKIGIDYFPLDCDFLSDEKMISVKVNYGAKGIAVTVALLCAIYRQGYFVLWNSTTALKIASDLNGVSVELVGKVVENLVKFGFFDKSLFDSASILTSAAIQRRYFSIIARSKRKIPPGDYIIVSPRDNRVSPRDNSVSPRGNPTKGKKNKEKKVFPDGNTKESSPPPPREQTYCGQTDNLECLERFFAPGQEECLAQLCLNLGYREPDIEKLRAAAEAIVNVWNLTDKPHIGYSDWSAHLVSTLKKQDKNKGGGAKTAPVAEEPTSTDYTFDGGFGGQDT